MKKILIIGGNGSGKTTFAVKLCRKTELPLFHLDKILRTDNWQRVSNHTAEKRLSEILKKDSWIIDGNDNKNLEKRLALCDTVFFFDFSTLSCFIGVIKRTIRNYGKSRDDVGGNNIEKFDKSKISFLKSVIMFNKKNRKTYYSLIEQFSNVDFIVFKSRKQAEQYLENNF